MTVLYLPLDLTASATTNFVYLEAKSSPVRATRVIKPNFGPYFTASVKVYSIASTGALTALTVNTQFRCVEFLPEASLQTGQEVCGAILITDATLPETFALTYQALGGEGNADLQAVAVAVRDRNVSNSTVTWDSVLDKPKGFAPTPGHKHDCLDLYGLEYLQTELQALSQALALGDDGSHLPLYNALYTGLTPIKSTLFQAQGALTDHLADSANPHALTKTQIGLPLVENRSTHAVLLNGAIQTPYSTPLSVAVQLQRLLSLNVMQALLPTVFN